MKNTYAVIMAGGVGSRFWPMSRSAHPKQFLDILGTGKTLLQQTYERFNNKICPSENIFVITHIDYVSLVKEQLPDIKDHQILAEPMRKNTAPCAAYASYKIGKINPKATIVLAPSDHLILKEETFVKAIKSTVRKAREENCLLTLGIKPTRPDTGYGYIQFKEGEVCSYDKRIKKVKSFLEKPNLEMAKFFIQSGDFLWNSGIFIWDYTSIKSAFEKYAPEIANIFGEGQDKFNTPDEATFIAKAYALCPNISIDYAIMEKAENVYVRSSILGWSDLGTWGSLYTHIPKDKNENAVIGKKVMLYDSKKCIINVPKDKLVILQGLEDYIVVESDDILLVCKKQDEQQIRNFVNDVKLKYGEKYI
jgi:mannose-1-phosphate guanylyltransferase